MRVSVLLPALDAGDTLDAALRSVRRQSFEDWECIVVDDGSRDDTAAIAAAHAAADARIQVIRQPRRGLVAALNAGIPHCRGAHIARMDADDLMHRKRLALQVAAVDDAPQLSGVGCHVWSFPRAQLTDGRRDYERWLNGIHSAEEVAREAFVECPIAHPTLLLRAEVLREFAYRERDVPEDYDLVLRMLAAGHRLAVVPRRLLAWRDSATRLSRCDPRYADAAFTRCKAEFLANGFLAATERYALCGYGGTGRALRRALAAHDKRLAYIVDVNPRRHGERIHGAPVLPPESLAAIERVPLLVSVAGAAPRNEIRAYLSERGWSEGRDYVCAA